MASREGSLAGIRVLSLTGDEGRSAHKLLAELGADVVLLGRGSPGPRMSALGEADRRGGVLDWWYDAGTRRAALDLHRAEGRSAFLALVGAAEILIEDRTPGTLEALGLGREVMRAQNPALVHVSLSPFGADGPRAGWRSSDLVAQALAGLTSVTGLPDEPVQLFGRQAYRIGGWYAAISALAGLYRARRTGVGCWVDLSLHQAVASCTEHVLMHWWWPEILAPFGAPVAGRQGSLHWIRAYEVVPCRRGACMVSPSAGGLLDLIEWMKSEGFASEIPDSPSPEEQLGLIEPLMAELRALALTLDATELFEKGQALHVPFGESYTVPQVLSCVQHQARGYFRPVEGAETVRLPGPIARLTATPSPGPQPPPHEPDDVDAIAAQWTARATAPSSAGAAPGARPLAGIRVLDFTHVMAGPFATRIMADLGADVIKIQTAGRAQGVNANEFPYFMMWHRSKRSVLLEMKQEGARDVLRRLVEQADVIIDNFSVGVMEAWGVGPGVVASWNPRIISISMSGAGQDGPWRSYVTFAPTVHALCGFTALTGPEGRTDVGPGVAFNDHMSGLSAATVLLSALEARRQSGRGQHVDMSQLEVGSYLIGPALLDALANQRVAVASGNVDPHVEHIVNDLFRTADDAWLAVTIDSPAELSAAGELMGVPGLAPEAARPALARWLESRKAHEAMEAFQAAGVAAGVVQAAPELVERDPQLAARDWIVSMESPLCGTQHTDRFPARWHEPDGREIELGPYRASPYLGEQIFEVYGELLGWDEARIAGAMGDGLFE